MFNQTSLRNGELSILNLLKNHQFTVGVDIMDPQVWALTSSKPDGS